jgi:hypothetical protein
MGSHVAERAGRGRTERFAWTGTAGYKAVAGAALAAFVVSMVWYGVFGEQLAELSEATAETTPEVWKVFVEFGRNVVVAAVLAGIAVSLGVVERRQAGLLGLAVWIGFPAMILVGSVLWEDVPVRPAAIHAGDWLVKLFVIATIVTLPQRRHLGTSRGGDR